MLYIKLLAHLKEAKSKNEQHVTSRHINDLASYKFSVGVIKGLQDAIDIYQEIFKGEFENENER